MCLSESCEGRARSVSTRQEEVVYLEGSWLMVYYGTAKKLLMTFKLACAQSPRCIKSQHSNHSIPCSPTITSTALSPLQFIFAAAVRMWIRQTRTRLAKWRQIHLSSTGYLYTEETYLYTPQYYYFNGFMFQPYSTLFAGSYTFVNCVYLILFAMPCLSCRCPCCSNDGLCVDAKTDDDDDSRALAWVDKTKRLAGWLFCSDWLSSYSVLLLATFRLPIEKWLETHPSI